MYGGKGSLVEDQSEITESLTDAIKNLADALEKFKNVLQNCRKLGMTDIDIRDAILISLPEEDRPAFMAQWPYFSMMLHVL